MPRLGVGSPSSRIMLVGDAYGVAEEKRGEPFVGQNGDLLNAMLHEAGIIRSECYVTNVVNALPPHGDFGAWIAARKSDVTHRHVAINGKHVLPIVAAGIERLVREINLVKPNIIVALGNIPMWALTGAWGILKWRGSQLLIPGTDQKVIPTIHPAAVLRQWELRSTVVNDLRRAFREISSRTYSNVPNWNFTLRPSFEKVQEVISSLFARIEGSPDPTWLDFDYETRAGHIACAGISWSRTEAICIPFMEAGKREGYWSLEEEAAVVYQLYKLLTHPKVKVRGQNLLYDCQYSWRWWHFIPHVAQDTMISQHTAFVALQKSLAYQASLYCDHYVYWKDDGKTWGEGGGEEQLWRYNCIDCVRTREVGETQLSIIPQLGLEEVERFQQSMFWPVLQAMKQGIRVSTAQRDKLAAELQDEISAREEYLYYVLGHTLNPGSSVQMVKLFYEDLQLPRQTTRAKKGVPGHLTCDDEALDKLSKIEPLIRPIINAIRDIRTLGVLLRTFVMARLDTDGRMRSSFNIAGNESKDTSVETGVKSAPYTYRLSSSKDAFGSGANLQNIPTEKSKAAGKAMARGLRIPNMRSMYIPDPGFVFFDLDLDRADLQVVVWEADDADLKLALHMGVDIHLLNVYSLDGKEPPPYEELVETHPKYPDHRGPRKHKREFAKVFCHATNYGGGARTVAVNTGRSIAEIDRAQRIWFGAHPGIRRWHERTLQQITSHHRVENKFGYRWHIFDRIDGVLPEALAWIPQSTVGIYINKIWHAIYTKIPEVQVLIQVHDSLAGQIPAHRVEELTSRIKQAASQIIIPYDDPLIIPIGISTSAVSWGDCA